MEKVTVINKNGNEVERTILGKLEGEALEICKNTKKCFVYLERSTGTIFASPLVNRKLSPEVKAQRETAKLEKKKQKNAIRLANYEKKIAEFEAKKAKVRG